MNTSHKEQGPPWRRRLEAKIEAAQRDASQLLEMMKARVSKVQEDLCAHGFKNCQAKTRSTGYLPVGVHSRRYRSWNITENI